MSANKLRARLILSLLVGGLVGAGAALAGSAVIGSVAGSRNATIGGQALLPNTTIFSGDSLAVKDGAAVVSVGSGSRLVFGRETAASFLRDEREVTVLLGQGNVSMYHPAGGAALRVKAGEISVLPAGGFKTLGEVAMLNGVVVVTAKEGKLRVEGSGPAVEVAKGKTITLTSKAARAPQGGAAGSGVSVATGLQVAGVAGSGVAVGTSTVAMSRAGDARDEAANAANVAADAVNAAEAAEAAAQAAEDAANAVGCALNEVASPDTPFPPANCD